MHGGGISDCSHYVGVGQDLESLLVGFVLRGFVVFNVEYRRGRILDQNAAFGSVQQELSNYRAAQDNKRGNTYNNMEARPR